jgi:hypothetical protein
VVIFDDLYSTALTPRFPQPFGWGLYHIWQFLHDESNTLAVAFFDLPKEHDNSDLECIVGSVTQWITRLEGSVIDYCILVDMNRGYEPDWPSGVDVLKALRTDPRFAFANAERVGVLSVSGASDLVVTANSWLTEYKDRTFLKHTLRTSLSGEIIEFLVGDDIERRLWPDGSDCGLFANSTLSEANHRFALWLDPSHPVMRHDWPDVVRLSMQEAARKALGIYLESVLRFPPPLHWLQDDEIPHLWQDLKHFVGAKATAHVSGPYNLTLGNLVLLLGASVGREAEACLKDVRWLNTNVKQQILPSQSREEARTAAKALAAKDGLFTNLSHHNKDGRFLLGRVVLNQSSLCIPIGFNARLQWKTQNSETPSLLEQIQTLGPYSGVVYSAYRRFLVASAVSTNGREAKCVLNLLVPSGNREDLSILEFRRCL